MISKAKTLIRSESPKVIKFLVGGGVNYTVNFILTLVLTEVLGLWYVLSFSLSQLFTIVFGFFFNSKVTFQSQADRVGFIKFLVVLFGSAVGNVGLVKLLTEFGGLYYLVSIFLSMTVFMVVKFILYRNWVFINKAEQNDSIN